LFWFFFGGRGRKLLKRFLKSLDLFGGELFIGKVGLADISQETGLLIDFPGLIEERVLFISDFFRKNLPQMTFRTNREFFAVEDNPFLTADFTFLLESRQRHTVRQRRKFIRVLFLCCETG